MSVAGASFVVGLGLVALAALGWIWLWADSEAQRPAVVTYLPALADCGMVALWLHALALATAGHSGFWAYAVTGVLVCAAAVLRHPPAAAEDEDEDGAEEQPVAPEVPGPTPAPAPRAGLWASR